MEVGDVMTRNVECVTPSESIIDAARRMKKLDVGALPVCGGNNRLVGMITDRDIVLRGVADRRDLEEVKVQEIMTPEIRFCTIDQPVEHAARMMRENQIRRLVVLDENRQLVGIVSLGDLAVDLDNEFVISSTLEGISQPAIPTR